MKDSLKIELIKNQNELFRVLLKEFKTGFIPKEYVLKELEKAVKNISEIIEQ